MYTLLFFFKDLGFVLSESRLLAVPFDSFEGLFLRYFSEGIEWLYYRDSLALLLRPGPSEVFTE